ncbi:hypothetical protein [Citromicrobium sp. JLT1363]|uniref:hypothetical protein n=1 Tax=Citromicrobium sp. JLT1363 TaxID=517722 RepID=UPI0002F1008A|nr:hypothetical protein [Citromicrobium sp. JLT1363]|tara:strand:- start:184 stop:384 length:201 start_codon:yes stop_codon:yes gene_type:complete
MLKSRRMVIFAAALAAPVIAYLGYLNAIDFWAADACLDRGGSYHYDLGECSFTENYRGDVPSLWPL